MTENDNERRAMVAFVLCIAVYFVWSSIYLPPPGAIDPGATAPITTDLSSGDPSSGDSSSGDSSSGDSSSGAPSSGALSSGDPSSGPASSDATPSPSAVSVPERTEAFTSEALSGSIHSSEGVLHALNLNDYTVGPEVTPLYSWVLGKFTGSSDGGWEPYSGGDDPYTVLTDKGGLVLVGAGSLEPIEGYTFSRSGDALVATHTNPAGLTIVKTYAPTEQPHVLDVTVRVTNNTGSSVSDLWFGVVEEMSGNAGRFQNEVRPVAHVDNDITHYDGLDDLDGPDQSMSEDLPPAWYGVGDRYFMNVLLPASGSGIGRLVVDDLPGSEQGEARRYGAFGFSSTPLDAGATRDVEFQAYIGPKQLDVLEGISPELADAVELGWFGFFARILLFLLKTFQTVVINWGLAILLLTLMVKLAFFPLTQKAFKSSRMMQAVQPELQAIREKYKDDQQMLSQETMKLFQEKGVNPLGGCLPTLIQLPVWIALYNVMLYSVELYDSSFLYLMDLTKEDPYGALPVVYALLILGQQQMMPMGNMDPTQRQVMKMMPLMFAAFMFTFPSGLVLYFCCNILLTIGQQFLINRTIKIETPATETPATEAS